MAPSAPRATAPTVSLGELSFALAAEELRDRANRLIESGEHALAELLAAPSPRTVSSFLEPLNALLTSLHDVSDHGGLIFAVHSEEATRAAGREVSEAAERFFNAYRLNGEVYAALRGLDLSAEDGPTHFAVGKMLREMRRAGVEKDPRTRSRIIELSNAIDKAGNQFGENIAKLDRELEVDSATDLEGLPLDYVAAHPPNSAGKIRLTTKYPDLFPVMAYCDVADVRRRMLLAFMNRAYPENMPVLEQMMALRAEFARAVGYPSFASYALEDKMIATPAAARAFLGRVGGLLREPALRDRRRYLDRKRRDHPDAAALDPWDSEMFGRGYYDSKIRAEEFGVDTRALRAYLPYARVRDGLLQLCRELFGVSFRRVPSAESWHPSVEVYDVERGSVLLGRCYLDLVPRDGKFNHAACFGVRGGLAGVRLPQLALVCNFLDPGVPSETARMEWGEVVTFFHEFGHLLHALLAGQVRWLFNGPSYVEWDFIEAPSQLFEEWARDPATLSKFARNPDTGEGIPEDLLARLAASEAFGRPSRLLRQVALSSASLEMYDRDPTGVDPSAAFAAAWNAYDPRPLPKEYHPTASFGHLAGYSAFYYTYVWSVVIARDLLSPFLARGNLTDPEVAERYASEILASGSCRPAAELIRAYLGRDFDFQAFEGWADETAGRPADRNPGATRPTSALAKGA